MNLYRFRCQRCNWVSDQLHETDPGTILCRNPDCATDDAIRWWSKGPWPAFVAPETAKQTFGEQPWSYTPTPEQLAEIAAREAARPVPVYEKPAPVVVEKEHVQLGLPEAPICGPAVPTDGQAPKGFKR
jgi:hypothetical protein